jgi:hypothetical protein
MQQQASWCCIWRRAQGGKNYFGFLSKLVPARKRLWGREMTPKTIGHTNRISSEI